MAIVTQKIIMSGKTIQLEKWETQNKKNRKDNNINMQTYIGGGGVEILVFNVEQIQTIHSHKRYKGVNKLQNH